MKTISPMKQWMAAATVDEQILLADRIGSTRGMLYQYAGEYRFASADRAGLIEQATGEMADASNGRLPRVYRTDLCDACRRCAYAHQCLGARAVVSEFEIVDERQLPLRLETNA